MRRFIKVAEWAGWSFLIITLPVTSFPLLSRMLGGTMVAPLSILCIGFLFFAWLLPYIWRTNSMPRQVIPLLAFGVVALIATLCSYFIPLPLFRDTTLANKQIEAGMTLVVGMITFLVAIIWPSDERRLRFTLQLINIGGFLLIAWSLAQVFFFRTYAEFPGWMKWIQAQVSIQGFYGQRATGFAFEPSWLAHQLNMFYLPIWLAASVRRASAFRIRLLSITVENVLLIIGLAVLWFSLSRVGLIAFILMVTYLMIQANFWLVRYFTEKLTKSVVFTAHFLLWGRRFLILGVQILLILIYISSVIGVGFALSKSDPRMAALFDLTPLRQNGLLYYANQLVFAERLVFWQAGWEVFNDYPILGVGLGNVGYYFPAKLPGFSWSLVEINQLMFRSTALPNVKSLWVRLLAETGLAGFACFVSWLVVLWLTGLKAQQSGSPLRKAFGLAGVLVIVGLLVEGFSVDTFALPYFWMSFGLAVAAWRVGDYANQPR